MTVLLLLCSTARLAANGPHAGPFFDRSPLVLGTGVRSEWLGPLFYWEQDDARRTWAIPPLLSRSYDPLTDFTEFDFAYPVLTYDRFGTEYRWQLGQLLSFSGGATYAGTQNRRFTLFPLYFQQRSVMPEDNYTAVVPFYGHLQNRLFRDDIFFVMFPAYSRTRKRDLVTDNYLYPFFHVRHGDSLSGWQFWPLYGHEQKGPTQRTNSIGEVATIGGHDKRFVLWPIYLAQRTGIGTENPGWQQALLPVYSLERSPQRDVTTVLWPFFNWIEDRRKQYREWDGPWPLVAFARGQGKRTSRVWPFFSRSRTATLESAFYLWPVYKYNAIHSPPLDRERTRILFFLYSDLRQQNTETGSTQRRTDLWPLFTQRRDDRGTARLQVFAPLEPLLPFSKSIERNYSPLWAAWRSEHNGRTGAGSQSLLWNTYRRDVTPSSRKYSLLFGLFQYQSGSTGKRLRILYVPVLRPKGHAAPDAPPGRGATG